VNHQQITSLFRTNDGGELQEHKMGIMFEVTEPYTYDAQFAVWIIPKGTKMVFHHKGIETYYFTVKPFPKHFHGSLMGFGRRRLLKLKLKELDTKEEKA